MVLVPEGKMIGDRTYIILNMKFGIQSFYSGEGLQNFYFHVGARQHGLLADQGLRLGLDLSAVEETGHVRPVVQGDVGSWMMGIFG